MDILEKLELLVENGYCPGLIYDDNGHWALSTNGSQNMTTIEGKQDIWTSFVVEADDWHDSPLKAIEQSIKKLGLVDSISHVSQ